MATAVYNALTEWDVDRVYLKTRQTNETRRLRNFRFYPGPAGRRINCPVWCPDRL
jgi:hypothetical protein